MMIKLRGHHLICLHYYDGEGYDEPFIRNLKKVLALAGKEGVQAVEGADEVCGPCPWRGGSACTFSDAADREIRQMDERALKLLGLKAGEEAAWESIREEASRVFLEWYRFYCFACTWRSACEKHARFRELSP
jgi:hypothetical protein